MKILIDPTTTASCDVDPQNGFTPNCPAELPVPGGNEIVPALNRQATYASKRVGSKDAHCVGSLWDATPEKPQFSPVGAPNVDIRWNRHCVVNTFGGQLLAGLPNELEYDFFVWKGIEPTLHPYGACYHDLAEKRSTGLIEWLKINGIKTVIVGGLATDYCVKTTGLQLRTAGFRVIINLEACRGISATTIEAAISEMCNAGCIVIDQLAELQIS